MEILAYQFRFSNSHKHLLKELSAGDIDPQKGPFIDINESLSLSHEGRIEIFLVGDKKIESNTIQNTFFESYARQRPDASKENILEGNHAVLRFFQIAVGLASPETGISSLEELEESYQKGSQIGQVGPLIHHLYQRGIWLYHKARQETDFFTFAVDIESVFRELAVKVLEPLDQVSVSIVGYDPITPNVLNELKQEGCKEFIFHWDERDRKSIVEKFSGQIQPPKSHPFLPTSVDVLLVFSPNSVRITARNIQERLRKRPDAPLLIFNWAEVDFGPIRQLSNAYLYSRQDIENVVQHNRTEQEHSLKIIDRWIQKEIESFNAWKNGRSQFEFAGIIGSSASMQRIFELIARVSRTDTTIVITGESGTGKELVAKAIHNLSARSKRPFVVVNCGAIPESLLESELFGHVRGAFTGAISRKQGLFEVADCGTIFLDEISELPLHMQVKLLRVLQEGEIKPVGSSETKKVDTRILAATNKNMSKLVEDGGFRSDLYYRLNVIELTVPPLRERPEDIPLLADYFLRKFSKKTKKNIIDFSKKTLAAIVNYLWPGNVRELENAVEHAVTLSIGKTISLHELPQAVLAGKGGTRISKSQEPLSLKELEKGHILQTLEACRWNHEIACKQLGIARSTLWRKLKEYDIINR